jgi:hypothetical protein
VEWARARASHYLILAKRWRCSARISPETADVRDVRCRPATPRNHQLPGDRCWKNPATWCKAFSGGKGASIEIRNRMSKPERNPN